MKLTLVTTVHHVVEGDPEDMAELVADYRNHGTDVFEWIGADRGEKQTSELYVGDPWDGEEIERRKLVFS